MLYNVYVSNMRNMYKLKINTNGSHCMFLHNIQKMPIPLSRIFGAHLCSEVSYHRKRRQHDSASSNKICQKRKGYFIAQFLILKRGSPNYSLWAKSGFCDLPTTPWKLWPAGTLQSQDTTAKPNESCRAFTRFAEQCENHVGQALPPTM